MIRVGVIGAGNWGKNLVRTFYDLGVLAAVAECDVQIHHQIHSQYHGVPVFEDYRSLLESPEIQAIAVATPAPTHYKVVADVLNSGKDVFVEKPMTLSGVEAQGLVDLAHRKGRILMVGHLMLYHPAIQRLKQLIEAGAIGRLRSLHQERMKLGRVRAVENVLWSFGVHDLAVLLYLVGEHPVEIMADGQRVVQPAVEDDVFVHITFPSGVKAHLHTCWLWPDNRRRLTVIGSTGTLVFDEVANSLTLHRKGINADDLSSWDEGMETIAIDDEPPLTRELRCFLESVERRVDPLSNGETGLAVVKMLELASEKLLQGAMS